MGREIKVYTKLLNKEIDDCLNRGIKELWNTFKTLEGNRAFKQQYLRVEKGIKIIFDIRLITNEFYEELPHYSIVKIARRWDVDIFEFWKELDEREKIMKETLRDLYDDNFDNQEEEEIEGYEE